MSQILITTENLNIRPFNKSHITEEYLSWLNDKKLMQFSEQRHKIHTRDSSIRYCLSFQDTDNYFFAIETKGDSLIGTLTVYQDVFNRIFDMGILIGSEDVRGQGLGFEAWLAVIQWIEKNFLPRKITAGTMANNKPMLGVMTKCGMKNDGYRKSHYVFSHSDVDMVYMAKFYKRFSI